MNLENVRVLVTGGAGFIGSEVVKQLCEQKALVTVLDNFSSGKKEYVEKYLGVKIIKGDICDNEIVLEALRDQELVFHLAALPFIPDSYFFPVDFFRVNTMGSINLLWATIQSETVKKFIHVSSSEVYGTAKYVPMNEDHPALPHSTYAVSKLAADRLVFTMSKEHGFPVVIIRPFNCYGPNITEPYIVPEVMLQLLSGKSKVVLGRVDTSRDFTYVEDTARGIILSSTTEKAVGETINLGSGKDTTIKELVQSIASLLETDVDIESDSSRVRPYDVDRLVCDASKAHILLGWTPKISLEEGLKRTLLWVQNNKVEFNQPFKGWTRQYTKIGR